MDSRHKILFGVRRSPPGCQQTAHPGMRREQSWLHGYRRRERKRRRHVASPWHHDLNHCLSSSTGLAYAYPALKITTVFPHCPTATTPIPPSGVRCGLAWCKVRQRAGQAVDLVDDDHVDLAARFRRLCNETRTPRTGTGHKAKGRRTARASAPPFPSQGVPARGRVIIRNADNAIRLPWGARRKTDPTSHTSQKVGVFLSFPTTAELGQFR